MKKEDLKQIVQVVEILEDFYEEVDTKVLRGNEVRYKFSYNDRTFKIVDTNNDIILKKYEGHKTDNNIGAWEEVEFWNLTEEPFAVKTISDLVKTTIIPYIKDNFGSKSRIEKFNKLKNDIEGKCKEYFKGEIYSKYISFNLTPKSRKIQICYLVEGNIGRSAINYFQVKFDKFFDDERFDKYELFEEE